MIQPQLGRFQPRAGKSNTESDTRAYQMIDSKVVSANSSHAEIIVTRFLGWQNKDKSIKRPFWGIKIIALAERIIKYKLTWLWQWGGGLKCSFKSECAPNAAMTDGQKCNPMASRVWATVDGMTRSHFVKHHIICQPNVGVAEPDFIVHASY